MDIIVDIDGTLANGQHRQHYIDLKHPDSEKRWGEYQKYAHLDEPITPVVKIVRELYCAQNRIILCSGRGEHERVVTALWLNNHFIPYNAMYLRSTGDYRSDDIIKEELLERIISDGFKPEFVFDDRQRVVDMWRRRGLVCAQVAEGNF